MAAASEKEEAATSKKILGIGLTIIGAALLFVPVVGQTLGLGLITTGIAWATVIGLGLEIAGSFLMGPSAPKGLTTNPVSRLTASLVPTTPRKIVFGGPTALDTDVRYQAYTGTNQAYLDMIICHASHEVRSIDELWLDNEQAWTAAGGAQGRYVGYLTVVTRVVGTSANGMAIDGTWTTACTLTGCAYSHLQFKLTGASSSQNSPFSSGVTSRMTFRGKGAKVYDPRLDTTVAGGSGSQRANDQTTWAWDDNASRNPALQELFYELGWKINGKLAVGKGVPPARIDLASFAVAANACDESITLNAGGTEPRYRSDGVVSEADDPGAVRDHLCATMNAMLRDAGGKLSLTVVHNDLATPAAPTGKTSFDQYDVQSGMQWEQTPDLHQSFNIVRGQRIDASNSALYQPADFPEVKLTSNDGIDRIDTFNLPLVQSNGQAQRLAKQRLQRNQYQGKLTFTGQPSFWGLNLGDLFALSHPAFGWSGKLFRCASQQVSRTGATQIVAVEENAAIYAWSNNEAAAVTPGAPVVYDPLNNALVVGINAAGSSASTAAAAAAAAQAAANAAQTDATSSLLQLNHMGDDAKLTPVEKRVAIIDYNFVTSEQSDNDAKATLYGVTTEKTNYDNAVSTLTTYLATLTTPVAWNNRSDYTTIVGATWNTNWDAVYSTRQLLLNKIAALAKALADAAAASAAPGDGNRVRFSRFEQGILGWIAAESTTPVAPALSQGNYQGIFLLQALADFTANGQQVGVGTDTVGGSLGPFAIPVTAGERIFAGAGISYGGATASGTYRLYLGWLDSTGVETGSRLTIASGTGSGLSFNNTVGAFTVVPSNAVSAFFRFDVGNNAGGANPGCYVQIEQPIVCSAGSAQTVFPAFSPGPSNESGADMTRWIEDPAQRLSFKYDYLGTAQAGEFSRDISLKLMTSGGQILSGIVWTYTVLAGTVNGFASGSAAQSMSGAGTGTMTVSSLGSSTASVLITATYSGKAYLKTITLLQNVAAAPVSTGGTGAGTMTVSKTNPFTAFSTTTFGDVTGAINGTMPASTTAATISCNLDALPAGSTTGSWTVECKVMRDIAGTPTQIGSVQTSSSYYTAAGGGEPVDSGSAHFIFSISDTGLTAGAAYVWRVYMRITSGTRTHNVTGTVTVTA